MGSLNENASTSYHRPQFRQRPSGLVRNISLMLAWRMRKGSLRIIARQHLNIICDLISIV